MFPFKNQGFTLIEILLYFGLFALIIGIIYPIFSETLKNYFTLREQIDLRSEMRNIFLRIQREVFKSKSIDILTDWEIIFNQKNEKVAIFLTQPIYLDLSSLKVIGYANNLSVGSLSFNGPTYSISFSASSTCQISSATSVPALYAFSGYAWSPNIGWIKFRNTDVGEPVYGVCLDNNNQLRGFAWNDVVGWLSFNCQDVNICGTSNYQVIVRNNYLYGYAWNEVIGWLIFDGQAGKVYLAKMNPEVYYLDLISDPRVIFQDLKFTKTGRSFKVNLKIRGPSGTYEEGETAIILPFE